MPDTYSELMTLGMRAESAAVLAAACGLGGQARLRYAELAELRERAAATLRDDRACGGHLVEAAWAWMRAGRSDQVDRIAARLEPARLRACERSRLREAVLRAHPRPRGFLN